MVDKVCQCGSCENIFKESELVQVECPHCHSGNWVYDYINELEEDSNVC